MVTLKSFLLSEFVQENIVTVWHSTYFIYEKWELSWLWLSVSHRITTTCGISAYHCELESHSWWGVPDTTLCDLRQVAGFLWVLRFPPPIKLTATIELKYCWSDIKHHNPNPWLNMCSENKCKQHIIFFLNKLKSYNEF